MNSFENISINTRNYNYESKVINKSNKKIDEEKDFIENILKSVKTNNLVSCTHSISAFAANQPYLTKDQIKDLTLHVKQELNKSNVDESITNSINVTINSQIDTNNEIILSNQFIDQNVLENMLIKTSGADFYNLENLFKQYGNTEEEKIALALICAKKQGTPDSFTRINKEILQTNHKLNFVITICLMKLNNYVKDFDKESNFKNLPDNYLMEGIKTLCNLEEHSYKDEFFTKRIWPNINSLLGKIKHEDVRLAAAKMVAEKNWNQFSLHLSDFNISPSSLMELMRIALDKGQEVKQILPFIQTAIKQDSLSTTRYIEQQCERASKQQDIWKEIRNQAFPLIGNYLAKHDVEALAAHVEELHFSPDQRLALVKLAASHDGGLVAKYIQQFKLEVSKETLIEIALSAFMQNQIETEKYLSNFNIDRLSSILMEKLSASVLASIEKKEEGGLQEIYFKSGPKTLEETGKILSQDLKSQKDDFRAHWACKFLEKAAYLYQTQDKEINKAIELRLLVSQLKLTSPANPLNQLNEKLMNPDKVPHPRGEINYGVSFNGMNSQQLKNTHFKVREIQIDGAEKKEVTFKTAYWAADQVRSNLKILNEPDQAKLIEETFQTQITISEDEPYYYYSCNERGQYDTNFPKLAAGPSLTVHLKNLGTIQIGRDPKWGSMINGVRLTLEKDASPEDLQKILAIMGLGTMMTQSTEGDKERLKVNTLIHFFYPKIAAELDRTVDYHEKPLPDLLNELEQREGGKDITRTIQEYMGEMEEYSVIGEERRLGLGRISSIAEMMGLQGLYSGISGASFTLAVERFCAIMQSKMLSTEKRCQAGYLIEGDSCLQDMKANSTDNIFLRGVTKAACDPSIKISELNNLSGYLQLLISTEVLNQMPYCHRTDKFGIRNPDTDNNDLKDAFQNRPNLLELIKENLANWQSKNELMIRDCINPEYIVGLIYQDPREILKRDILERLDGLDPYSSAYEEAQSFIDQCDSEGLDFITNHPQETISLLDKLFLQEFDPNTNRYKGRDVLTHWAIDPQKAIIQALEAANIDPSRLIIQKQDYFNEEILKNCQNSRQKAMAIAGTFQTPSLLGTKISDHSSLFLSEIKNFFASLPENELQNYLNDPIKKKIEDLRDLCATHLSDVKFSGQDSLNRELLTSRWNNALKDKDVILGLFALEAIKNKNPDAETNHLIKFSTNKGDRLIPELLYLGLKDQHPILLERLPNNSKPGPKEDSPTFFNEYIRRSYIQNTFEPVLIAIQEGYEKLLQKKPSLALEAHTQFNQPYDSEKWKAEYPAILEKIVQRIDSLGEDEEEISSLLELISSEYTPFNLKYQVGEGFDKLVALEGIQAGQMTLEELIDHVTKSPFLLAPEISHLFYDRLHLLAALTSADPSDSRTAISTGEGNVSLRDLMQGIMQSFSRGVTEQNAIAAEQFYLRLIHIYQKMDEKGHFKA